MTGKCDGLRAGGRRAEQARRRGLSSGTGTRARHCRTARRGSETATPTSKIVQPASMGVQAAASPGCVPPANRPAQFLHSFSPPAHPDKHGCRCHHHRIRRPSYPVVAYRQAHQRPRLCAVTLLGCPHFSPAPFHPHRTHHSQCPLKSVQYQMAGSIRGNLSSSLHT